MAGAIQSTAPRARWPSILQSAQVGPKGFSKAVWLKQQFLDQGGTSCRGQGNPQTILSAQTQHKAEGHGHHPEAEVSAAILMKPRSKGTEKLIQVNPLY